MCRDRAEVAWVTVTEDETPVPSRKSTIRLAESRRSSPRKRLSLIAGLTIAASLFLICTITLRPKKSHVTIRATDNDQVAHSLAPQGKKAEEVVKNSELKQLPSNVFVAESDVRNKLNELPKETSPMLAEGTVQSTFDPDKLKLIPQKKYSLTKVLSTPKDFAEQLVIPTGMFHLAPSPADNVNGQRKYAVIEHKIESRGNDSLGMSSAASVELEVEQRLAERLDLLGTKTLAEKVSILTLWISAEGNEMMVKVDILQQCKPGLKRGFAPKGDVDYFTLQVTPEGQVEGKANDEDWEKPERMNRFANAWKARVRGYKNMLQANRDAQMIAAMSTLYQGMLRNAAADQAQQRQQQRAIGIGR